MAKPKKKNLIKNLAIVAGVLALLQVGLWFYFQQSAPVEMRDAIKKAADSKSSLDSRRREQLKVQLAVAAYVAKHEGKPPPDLKVLVPDYFDSVPKDPATNEPFAYRVEGTKYFVGSDTSSPTAKISLANGEAPASEAEQKALIDSLSQPEESVNYVYDATGKRDPFMPFNLLPKIDPNSTLTPLERYAIGQLKYTAYLTGLDQPKAMIEDESGQGYPVSKGTKVGNEGGEIIDIQPDKILIIQTSTDFTGEAKTQTIEMKMNQPDQKAQGKDDKKKKKKK